MSTDRPAEAPTATLWMQYGTPFELPRAPARVLCWPQRSCAPAKFREHIFSEPFLLSCLSTQYSNALKRRTHHAQAHITTPTAARLTFARKTGCRCTEYMRGALSHRWNSQNCSIMPDQRST